MEYKYNILSKNLIKGDSVNEDDDNEWARYSPDSTYMVFIISFLWKLGMRI